MVKSAATNKWLRVKSLNWHMHARQLLLAARNVKNPTRILVERNSLGRMFFVKLGGYTEILQYTNVEEWRHSYSLMFSSS